MNLKSKIVILIVFILLILIKGYLFSIKYASDEKQKEYTVFIESLKSSSNTKVAYNVKLLNTSDKFILNIYDNSYDNIQTDLSRYSNYKYGDLIKVKGKISVPELLKNPGEFNYKQYLYSNNIYGLINTYEIPEQIPYTKNFIQNIHEKIYVFKEYVQNLILSSMSGANANVAISMIYGDTTNLDEQIQEDFENIGVSHLMSVSGTHITSFMLVINLIIRERNYNKKMNKKDKDKRKIAKKSKIKGVAQILSILVYIVFTGFSVSVLRAGIMLIVSIISDMFNVKKNKYMAMLIAVLVILVHTPFAIFNTGFRLSFLATLGIILFRKYIIQMFNRTTNKIQNELIKKVVGFLIENIAITIAVQLLIIPIQIQAFNKLPFPVIIPNLVMGIISTPIRVIGTIGIMSSFIPMLSIKIFSFVEIFVKLLLSISNIFQKSSFDISTVSQPLIFFVIYYLFVLCIFLYFKLKNITRNKEGQYNLQKLLKYLKICSISFFILAIVIAISLNVYSICFSEYVYFFNVEQGDMSYIKSGEESVIVDIGSMRKGLSFNTISSFFEASNLNRVDTIVVSHMHTDHMNGLENFLQKYEVGEVIYTKPRTIDKAYTDFLQMLKKYNVKGKEVKQGDIINIGKIKIEVLLPDDEYIKEDEENENSLICKITVKDKDLLYMGDASKNAEEKLLKEDVDISNIYILKVGHHGSKTATSEEFIHEVQPKHAIISALKKYYGHPHENTMDTLRLYDVYTYLTEVNGAIKFSL